MTEVYESIDEFENYEVSNFGNVRNVNTGLVLKKCVGNHGYYVINLMKDKKRIQKLVHQLVANKFVENKNNKPHIDHIDGDKLNNYVSNLRFATYQENQGNSKIPKNNTSGEKGVNFNKKYGKWEAYITVNKIKKNIGYYDTLAEASHERAKRANEVFGEFTHYCEKNLQNS